CSVTCRSTAPALPSRPIGRRSGTEERVVEAENPGLAPGEVLGLAAQVNRGSVWHVMQTYLAAVVAVGVALGASFLLPGTLHRDSTLLLLLGAVTFSAWCGSMGPGLLATLLGAVPALFLFKTHTQSGLEQG